MKPFILGISGLKLTQEEIELFRTNPVAGFILFGRNIESKLQLKELTSSLKSIYLDRSVPIYIDQEGGRVARVKPPVSKRLYPSAAHFAEIYDSNPIDAKQELRANYMELMSELKSFGIDSPCAPVCDLYFEWASDVIGDRSYGATPGKVITLAKSAIMGIEHAGGIPFIKHIPGHGRARVDSHYDLPIVDTPINELEDTDFRVFKELASEKVYAMTAHIIYTNLDKSLPATISPPVIKYVRDNIGFKGTLVTDDINMYALHGEVGKVRSTLKKVIQLAQDNKDWKKDYSDSLTELFDFDTAGMGTIEVIELCRKKLSLTKSDFIESLKNVTKMSLKAGCDIVLHCSGDIDEMKAILQVSI